MHTRKLIIPFLSICFLLIFFHDTVKAQEEVDAIQYEMKDTVLARALLEEMKSLIVERELNKAMAKGIEAENIYSKFDGSKIKEIAEVKFQFGRIAYYERKYEKAIKAFEEVLRIQILINGEVNMDVAATYNGLGVSHEANGSYSKAVLYKMKALDIRLELLGPNHPTVAQSFNNIGVSHYNQGEYDLAIEYYEKALKIRMNILDENHSDIAYSFYNLATSFDSKGEFNKAIDYYNKSLRIWEKTLGGWHPDVAYCYNNLGVCFMSRGEYDKAIECSLKAMDIWLTKYGDEYPDLAYSLENLGNAHYSKGGYDKAIELYIKALKINLEILEPGHSSVATTYNNLGSAYNSKGNYALAIEYKKKALEIRLNALGPEHPYVASSFNNLGLSYFLIGDYDKSLEYFNKSFDIRQKLNSGIHPDLALTSNNIGNVYFALKKYNEALKFFEIAIDASNFNPQNIGHINSHEHLIDGLIGLSKVQKKIYEDNGNFKFLSGSFDNIKRAIDVVNYEKLHFFGESSQIHWIYRNHIVYYYAIELSILKSFASNQHLFTESFTFSEKSKAGMLQSQIKSSDALQYANIPDDLLQKEYDLRIDITYYEKKRQEKLSEGLEETDTTVLTISSKLFDLNWEYEALKERFETDYPDYYKLKYDLSTVSLEYVQDTLLTADQTLLEYFVGDSSIFIFTVGKEQYDVVEVKRDFPLEDWVKQLQHGLTGYYTQPLAQRNDGLYKTTVKQYMEASQQLYGKLIAPVKEKLNTSELTIVPDGLLGYVPFGALLSGQPKRASIFDTYPFLEKEYKISYCYSATLLREMKEKQHKRQPTGSLVAFAPFYEGSYELLDTTISLSFDTLANGQDTLIFNDIVTRKDFNNLPASGEEVKAASLFWDGDYYLNSDATEDRFNEVAGNYRIIHLSTHGVADSRSGDYSYLAFAEQKDSIENELLYVRDLYNIQLNADLVTLSACETAAGELQRGEGIISLARAFAYAGAKSIVTTLWVAEDNATKDLMKVFYQQLKKGDAKDTALQKAKLKLLDDRRHAHPFFWAGFVPVGDMSVME